MQQSAVCDMTGFQASLPRMKDGVDYEEYERLGIMKIFVQLFILSSWLVGINEIRKVYKPQLNREVNIEYMN